VIPTLFRGAWCASGLGAYRPCQYAYERYPIASIPPLNEAAFTGDFAWFGDTGDALPERAAEMNRLAADLAACGLCLPPDFVALQSSAHLYLSLDEASGTGCWTNLSTPLPSPLEPDARMVRFFRDQQDCVMWYLYLRPSGESFIVHSYRDIEYEAEVNAIGDPEEIEDLPDYDNDPDYEIFWCAPTVEVFSYRVWMESRIQRALAEGRSIDDLDPRQRVYLAHYLTEPGSAPRTAIASGDR
jgi:hypothetical protein